jgi:hypothetical protein
MISGFWVMRSSCPTTSSSSRRRDVLSDERPRRQAAASNEQRPGQPPHYLRRGAQARLDAETAGYEAKEMIALGVG